MKNNNEMNKGFANCRCGKKNVNSNDITSTLDKTFVTNYDSCKTETASKKETYRCAICGKAYDSIDERVACETKCLADRKKIQAELEKKKLEEKKTARKDEIVKKYKELAILVNDYCNDYGSLQIGESNYFNDDYPTLSKLLGWWF